MIYLLNIIYGTLIIYFLMLNNILDEKYETASRDYSQMDRSFNFGIKSSILTL